MPTKKPAPTPKPSGGRIKTHSVSPTPPKPMPKPTPKPSGGKPNTRGRG